jgi:hypothetical protein
MKESADSNTSMTLQGTLVKSVYPHGSRINVTDLPAGVYLLKVIEGNRDLRCTKLIRE